VIENEDLKRKVLDNISTMIGRWFYDKCR
jgi:hypothetical protein